MEINILGPMEVSDSAGRPIRLPEGRERSLLVLLLIDRGAVVSSDRILEALWGERPPETAAKAMQGYVSHLRRVLERERERGADSVPEGIIVTRSPGYALLIDQVEVDAVRFERLAAGARRALEDGSPGEALAALDDALALWRGPALLGFAFDAFARDEIRRLEQLRLSAQEDRFDALLALGRHAAALGELEALVAANPLHEHLRGQWMLALYRSGRQADALEAYRDGRRLLSSELGLEPTPELQRLERAILAQDPALDAPTRAPSIRHVPSGGERQRRRRPGRRRLLVGCLLLAALLALAAFAILRARDGGPASASVVAPALVGVDASTNRIVASIRVGPKPTSIAAGTDVVWVGDAQDGTVRRVDPSSRQVIGTVGIGAPALDLALDARNVWVATGGFGTVVRIDRRLGQVVDRIELGDPGDPVVPAVSSVSVSDGRVWVGAFNGLALIDPATGEITKKIDLGQAPALQIASGGGAVWSTLLTRRAKRVDAQSGKETAEFYAGAFAIAIALDRSALWLAGAEGGQLWKIDPVTAATLLTSRAGNGADAIALGSGSLWIAASADHALVRVDTTTGTVLATIPVDGRPEDLVVREGIVWVIVQKPEAPG
jgi:DNA-binding SARP family transcriptional activator/DNA-binding beta-propeller fold protein YncE